MSGKESESGEQTETSHRTIGGGRALSLLAAGTIELEGQVPWSSNYTFLVTVRSGEDHALAIYKPTRGERPLWDFGEGTLCHREVAAFRLSDALGWPNIPPTVLCDGPYGRGSLQLYIDAEFEEHFFSLRERGGFDPAFREIALFDCLVNNADRRTALNTASVERVSFLSWSAGIMSSYFGKLPSTNTELTTTFEQLINI